MTSQTVLRVKLFYKLHTKPQFSNLLNVVFFAIGEPDVNIFADGLKVEGYRIFFDA